MFLTDRICSGYDKLHCRRILRSNTTCTDEKWGSSEHHEHADGKTAGTIGETSAIAILIGAIFLILMGVIDLRIPASYIITFVVFILLFGGHGFDMNYVTAQLCGGGLMLGAFFMATDYVTSPITPRGQIIFGICCGIFTGLFRCFGANAEGVSFAIILSNLLVPMIEKYTVPNAFGVVKTKPEKEAK